MSTDHDEVGKQINRVPLLADFTSTIDAPYCTASVCI
jgi:hypothetical protein